MDDEMEAMESQGTWVLVDYPPDVDIIGSKWVFTIKYHFDGSIAKGYIPMHGIDFFKTFSSITRLGTICLVIYVAVYSE